MRKRNGITTEGQPRVHMCGKFTVVTDNNVKKEVFPNGRAKLYEKHGETVVEKERVWGIPIGSFYKKTEKSRSNVIFNSRAESVTEKPMFRDAFRLRRVAVPVVGFSEWSERRQNGKRQENYFESEDGSIFYLAGIALNYDSERFTVLTTAAVSTKEIHPRFPLLLSESEYRDYLLDDEYAEYFLRSLPKELRGIPL